MHKPLLSVILLVAAVVTPVGAQGTARPNGAPPKFLVISRIDSDNDRIYFHATHVKMMPVTTTKAIQLNGRTSYVTQTEYRAIRERSTRSFFLSKTKVYNAQGKEVANNKNTLKPGMTVVVSADGQPIDPVYRSVLRNDAVLLVVPVNMPAVSGPGLDLRSYIPPGQPPVPNPALPPIPRRR